MAHVDSDYVQAVQFYRRMKIHGMGGRTLQLTHLQGSLSASLSVGTRTAIFNDSEIETADRGIFTHVGNFRER